MIALRWLWTWGLTGRRSRQVVEVNATPELYPTMLQSLRAQVTASAHLDAPSAAHVSLELGRETGAKV